MRQSREEMRARCGRWGAADDGDGDALEVAAASHAEEQAARRGAGWGRRAGAEADRRVAAAPVEAGRGGGE